MRLPSRVLALSSLAGALLLAGGLALTAGAGVNAQTGSPTPASSVGGPAAVPLARFFGSVSGAGVTSGGTVTAKIGTATCGSGSISGTTYSVDIQGTAGCTTPGATVTFSVGANPAGQTGTVPAVSSAVQLNLTVTAATPTPAPTAASTPPPPPPPPAAPTARPATAAPTVAPTIAPTAVVPARPPSTGLGGGNQQAPVVQKPATVALPNTGSGALASSDAAHRAIGLVAVAGGLMLLATGSLAFSRRRD